MRRANREDGPFSVISSWNDSTRCEFIDSEVKPGTTYLYVVAARNQSADIHVARMRVRAALNSRTSGNAFVQFNSTTNRLDFNVRLRYAFAEGTDLWLVYNEGLDTERDRDAIGTQSPLSLSRALILKYTHTFGF